MTGQRNFWKQTAKQKIRKKGEGVGIMACAFVSEQLGFLSISHEQLADINALRARANKGPLKYYTEHDGRIYPSLHLFEHGKDREGFWGGDDMRDHTDELIDILEYLYGNAYIFGFLFDWSSGHAKYPEGALNVNVMQVNFNGKQETKAKLNPACILDDDHDYSYPEDFPQNLPRLKIGDIQHMVFQENDPPPFCRPNLARESYVGKCKGMKQVLYERGLYVQGMTENGPKEGGNVLLSMKYVLGNCLDFKTQKSQLQLHIESRGHICDFFPKYHPELSAIERTWRMAKRWLRRVCKYNYDNLVKKIPIALFDPAHCAMQTIRRFFRKCRDYQSAYRLGLSGPEVGDQLKVYKSHRMPPTFECSADMVNHKPYQLKKKIQQQKQLDEMRAIFDSLMIASDDNTLEASKEAEYDTCGTEFSELIARLQIIAEDDTF